MNQTEKWECYTNGFPYWKHVNADRTLDHLTAVVLPNNCYQIVKELYVYRELKSRRILKKIFHGLNSWQT